MDTRFAITEYPDATVLNAELDALIKSRFTQSADLRLKNMRKSTSQRSAKSLRSRLKRLKQSFPAAFSTILLSTILSRLLW